MTSPSASGRKKNANNCWLVSKRLAPRPMAAQHRVPRSGQLGRGDRLGGRRSGRFKFLFVSKQAERILGYPVERWLSEADVLEGSHPSRRPRVGRGVLRDGDRGTKEITTLNTA